MTDGSAGWLPWGVAEALVEHGHAEVARRRAMDGDWNCARAVAGHDEPDAALAVLWPFADRGRWEAVTIIADRAAR